MAAGFFKAAALTAIAPVSLIPKCGACELFRGCESPKMPVSGRGLRKILVVGEAPGKNEDREGKQFVGESGQKLSAAFARAGIDLRNDCWLTNTLICRPPGNAKPTDKQIAYCRPNLTRAIRELNPEIIIPVGEAAVKAVLMGLWSEDVGPVGRWVGWRIPCRDLDAWICPIWHPSYLLRNDDPALALWFQRYINRIGKIQGRPWGKAGKVDLAKQIEVITNPRKAARRIRGIRLLGDFPSSLDIETNCKNPDHPNAEIVCCSICFEGRVTIAYPWAGAAIDATAEFLQSPAPKRGANIKFEEKWFLKEFGFGVTNWEWDCVLAAHVGDNRRQITSVKFQLFVREGVSVYDEAIKPYLKDDDDGFNRIGELDLRKLLIYCGIDSLGEYKIAESQMKELGYGIH